MRHIRIIHRLRTFLAIAGFFAVAGVIGLVGWANQTGLPDSWRQGVAEALAHQGIHAELASLRFVPFRGFEASEVVIYSDPLHQRVAGRLEKLLFELDRTRLTRGEFRIERLNLSGARFSVAADPLDPDSEKLEIADLSGRVEFSGPRSIHISQANGRIHGIRLDVHCHLDLFRSAGISTPQDEERARQERRRLLLNLIHTLDSFDFHPASPPRIRLEVQGDLEEPTSLRASFQVRGKNLQARELVLREVDLRGELHGPTLVVHQASVIADTGALGGNVEYDLDARGGRFHLRSTLDVPALLRQLELPLPEKLPTFSEPPLVEAKGEFAEGEDGWQLRVIGHADLKEPAFNGIGVEALSASFAWDGTSLLVDDLMIRERGGWLTGRALIEPDIVRYSATSTLPLDLWQKSIPFEPLRTVLNNFSGGPGLSNRVTFRGHANPRNPHDWSFKGKAESTGLSYCGVPTRTAHVTLDLQSSRLDFIDAEVVFDYGVYPLKKRHGGPESGKVGVSLIRYDDAEKTVVIKDLEGVAWPAPIVRTFAPKVADHLESYGFHRTPQLSAQGTIGVMTGLPKQDLTVRFSTDDAMDYEFLGETLELSAPRGVVRVLPDQVEVNDLSFGALGGQVRASLSSRPGPPATLSGAIDWTELDLIEIAEAYDFQSEFPGLITGRADFTLTGGEVKGLDGEGHVALERAQLFDVPILGPLSPVAAAVLGNRKAGFQEASSAFFSFEIEDGIVRSQDFLTTTRSMVFTGDGSADLNDLELDMTVRMNARGLFGMLTLPFKPFYGLFQFRGTGPIHRPEWNNVMFTSPPEEQNERLLAPPRARPVGGVEKSNPKARAPNPPNR